MFAYEGTEILVQRDKEVQMAVHEFGEGRSVYISGLPYSFENSRILYRSICGVHMAKVYYISGLVQISMWKYMHM